MGVRGRESKYWCATIVDFATLNLFISTSNVVILGFLSIYFWCFGSSKLAPHKPAVTAWRDTWKWRGIFMLFKTTLSPTCSVLHLSTDTTAETTTIIIVAFRYRTPMHSSPDAFVAHLNRIFERKIDSALIGSNSPHEYSVLFAFRDTTTQRSAPIATHESNVYKGNAR